VMFPTSVDMMRVRRRLGVDFPEPSELSELVFARILSTGPYAMPNIKALRQRLAELAPDGRDIGEALRPTVFKTAKQVSICKLVSLIRKAKPKRNSSVAAPNKFLRMQICSRVNYCDFNLHVGAQVDNDGTCHLVIFPVVTQSATAKLFAVPATWKAETLFDHRAQKHLLLSKQFVRSVPLGVVYSVRYVNPNGIYLVGRAVQATSGGDLRLMRTHESAVIIAEGLFRHRFAELAGM